MHYFLLCRDGFDCRIMRQLRQMRSCTCLPLLMLALVWATATTAGADMPVAGFDRARLMISLSGNGWKFDGGGEDDVLPDVASSAFNSASWVNVTVPHNFQTRTSMTTEQGWYRRTITVTPALARKHLYLVFEGAATVADVYVNGTSLGEHRGAYTRFVFDATQALHIGSDNVLAVKVDNRRDSTSDCLPSVSGLYTVWGGLYRNVWLLATDDLHIDPTYYASPGVFITPSGITRASAAVDIKVHLRNTSSATLSAYVTAIISNPAGTKVAAVSAYAVVPSGKSTVVDLAGTVEKPEFWSPEAPNLYHVRVLVSHDGLLTDSLTQPLGFRTLDWDFINGLLKVNGNPYTLYGVDLHQEIETKQSAVQPADLIANFDTMKDLGVNFVRLAHYPRAQLEYDLCDERGIFCWAENGHSHDDLSSPTADKITTEMVEQNYNHPSIIIWSVGNEGVAAPAEREVPVVKALDTTRAVMVANMPCANADYRAVNTYPGWYGGDRWHFQPKGFISEVGGGGVVGTHTDYADAYHSVDTFEPEEYQQLCAEAILEKAFRRNNGNLGMFTWWNLREFNDFKYKSKLAVFHHGINTKGLLTYGGYKKDVYYLYRCFMRPNTPTVHITSKEYFLRTGAVDNGIKVYSDAKALTLIVDGQTVSTLRNGQYSQNDLHDMSGSEEVDNVFYWPAPLHTGKNTVSVSDGSGDNDSATIYFYGADGLPELPIKVLPVMNLASSNPANPVYYMDMPVQTEWPVYYDFDSTADNTLDSIPTPIAGARWLALHRVTKPGMATTVTFTAARSMTVYVIATKEVNTPDSLAGAGFTLADVPPFQWRGNDLILVDAELYEKYVASDQKVSLAMGDRDEMVLLK